MLKSKGVISFTYDDCMPCHLDAAMPDLEAHGFRGTFYVCPIDAPDRCWVRRREDWIAAAERGHEIANHTLYHPCRTFKDRDLRQYTLAQITEEIEEAEQRLADAVGCVSRSFAYPCGHMTVGPDEKPVSYIPSVDLLYPAARGCEPRLAGNDVELMQAPSFCPGPQSTMEWFMDIIEQATVQKKWATFTFHGIDEGWIITARQRHQAVLAEVARRVRAGQLLCQTFVSVAEQIRANREPAPALEESL
jgi:sialate O-acetylesterase